MQESVYSKDRSRAYYVRSFVHLAMASTVEARTAEKAKVCVSESCDRKPRNRSADASQPESCS